MISKLAGNKGFNRIPLAFLLLFPFYFAYDLYTGNLFFMHRDFGGMYYPFRQWFLGCLMNLEFPLWNPYWGAGHEAVIWSTVPVDFYSILEIFIKPHYEYFYLIHCLVLVSAGYYVFRKWNFDPWKALAGSLFFFMSPMVTHWHFEFIKTNLFAAHIFAFFFMVKWFETGKLRYICLMGWAFFFGMFGTKLEYWFFGSVYFLLTSVIAFFVMRPQRLSKLFLVWAGIVTAIAAQSWQINLLVNALKNSNRIATPHGLQNLFSLGMYRDLYLSLGDSARYPLALICVLLFVGIHKTSFNRWILIAASIVLSLCFRFWEFPFLLTFLKSPVFFGAIIATILMDRTKHSRKYIFSAWVLFMLPAYYWCRPLVNPDETYLLGVAPLMFKGIWGFLVWLGCLQIHRCKTAKFAYLSIVLVLVMEVQGQIVLSYLFGYLWMPARDNYLMDFSFAVISIFGLLTYFRFRLVLLTLVPFIIAFSSCSNFYYTIPFKTVPGLANPLLTTGLPYNPYSSLSGIKKAIEGWGPKPYRRVIDPYIEPRHPQSHGTFLLESTGNATFYGSMTPLRYSQLINFYRYGLAPQEMIAVYAGNYSEGTISRLPEINLRGFSYGVAAYMTVWTIPPLELDLLKILGVEHFITRSDTLIPPKIQELKLKDVTKSGSFNIAKLSDTLPRAFLVTNVTNDNLRDFKENMKPKIEMYNDQDFVMPNVYKAKMASILEYKREHVAIDVNSPSGGYLVLTDVFHPYWSASIDGKPAEIIPAFHAFRAVRTPPGTHRVDFTCRVPHFKSAFLLSFILIVVSLPVTIILWEKKIILPDTS